MFILAQQEQQEDSAAVLQIEIDITEAFALPGSLAKYPTGWDSNQEPTAGDGAGCDDGRSKKPLKTRKTRKGIQALLFSVASAPSGYSEVSSGAVSPVSLLPAAHLALY